MSIPRPSHWPDFADPDELDFRTVCNEAVGPADRPLHRKVVYLAAHHRDSHALFESRVASSGVPADRQAIFAWLMTEPRWRLIVTQVLKDWKVEVERNRTFWQNVSRWLNERRDGKHSVKEQAASVLLASVTATAGAGGAALVAIKVLGPDTVSIPVSFHNITSKPMEIRVATSTDDKPLPVRLAIHADDALAKVPINVSVEAKPLQLAPAQLAELNQLAASVASASAAIGSASRTLPQLVRQATEIQQTIARIQTTDPKVAEYFKPIAAALTGIELRLKEGQEQAKGISALAEEVGHTRRQIALLNGTTGTGRTLASVTAMADQQTAVPVIWLDANGAPRNCKVAVTLGKVAGAVEVPAVQATCGTYDSGPIALGKLRVGDLHRVGNLPIAVAIDRIARPMFEANYVTLRLVAITQAGEDPLVPARRADGQ